MKKTLFLIIAILLVALLIGCKKEDTYDTMTEVPDIDIIEEPEENPMEEIVTVEKDKPLVLKEGCFYEKELIEYEKGGIAFYRLEFRDERGITGYNFTSKTDTTIGKLLAADVGVCIYQDRWQFFDREGQLWSFRDLGKVDIHSWDTS